MFVFHPIREDPNSNILVWRRTKKAATSYQLHLAEMCLRMAEMFLAETHGMHGPFPNGRDSMAAKPTAAARRKFSPRKSQTGNEDHNLGFKRYTGEISSKATGFIPQHTSTLMRFPGWSRLRISGHHQFHRSFHQGWCWMQCEPSQVWPFRKARWCGDWLVIGDSVVMIKSAKIVICLICSWYDRHSCWIIYDNLISSM